MLCKEQGITVLVRLRQSGPALYTPLPPYRDKMGWPCLFDLLMALHCWPTVLDLSNDVCVLLQSWCFIWGLTVSVD